MILLVQADARRLPLPSNYVQTVITSPPYWGLRDYGTARWEGGDVACPHTAGRFARGGLSAKQASNAGSNGDEAFRRECGLCGARRIDQGIGLEPTPDAYVANLVAVFREIRRVLRDDGTVWLNLGDTYCAAPVGAFNGGGFKDSSARTGGRDLSGVATSGWLDKTKAAGLKPKDLVGIPWRVAFALQADGWYLRSDIVWAKGYSFHPTTAGSCMPESVTDRPTRGHEYVFLLTKSARYYYDAEAVKESGVTPGRVQTTYKRPRKAELAVGPMARGAEGFNHQFEQPDRVWTDGAARNLRSVWLINPQPYRGAHFATFPPALVEPCLLAGSPADCCGACGTPYRRIVERTSMQWTPSATERRADAATEGVGKGRTLLSGTMISGPSTQTLGWSPACTCAAEPAASVVLDPFCGSGTVGLVARQHGRIFVGLDLKMDYLRLAQVRNGLTVAASAPQNDDLLDPAPAPCPEPIASEEAS